ncbi:hypothetical protein AURDEDRAFT_120839 [Auricularia subglabra TFB-10046 SS5]|nr:hypothetical protein AURDEDRAFT_120839 [Auricularia subglabra TFB-10046 SS5]
MVAGNGSPSSIPELFSSLQPPSTLAGERTTSQTSQQRGYADITPYIALTWPSNLRNDVKGAKGLVQAVHSLTRRIQHRWMRVPEKRSDKDGAEVDELRRAWRLARDEQTSAGSRAMCRNPVSLPKNKIWVQRQTDDHRRDEGSVQPPASTDRAPALPHSSASLATTTAVPTTTSSSTTDHAAREPAQTLDARAEPGLILSDDDSSTCTIAESFVSRATSTLASSTVSSNSPADDGTDDNNRKTPRGAAASDTRIDSANQQRLRTPARAPGHEAAKGKSAMRGLKRAYEEGDTNPKDKQERSSAKRAREAAAGPSRAQHPHTPPYDSRMPGSSAQASRAARDLHGPSTMGGVHGDNAMVAAQTSANATAAPQATSADGVGLGQTYGGRLQVVAGGALPGDEDSEQPPTDQQGSGDAQASLGHHAQANNNLRCTPGMAVAKYAADKDRLRAEARTAVRILELPLGVAAASVPDDVPRARPETVDGHIKDALRGILGIPLNGSRPGWTNCDACFVAAEEDQFFDQAAQRVAAAEADAPTVPDASKPTVLRNALLRELQTKELSRMQERMTATNPLGGIRPKVLTDAVVDEIRAEIRGENTTGGQQGSSTRV